jgi:hypothetical protein
MHYFDLIFNKFTSIIMIVFSLVWLFRFYFGTIIRIITSKFSGQTLEIIIYVLLSYVIYSTPNWFHPETTHIWALIFAFGLTLMTIWTALTCAFGNAQLFLFLNMLIHGFTAIHVNSILIACTSVLFLMVLLDFQHSFDSYNGYRLFFRSCVITDSHKNELLIPSAMLTSGITTLLGIIFQINFLTVNKVFVLFVPGLLWFGPLIFFVSLLIISSKNYSDNACQYREYIIYNVLTLMLSASFIFIGIIYDIPQLLGICGTFYSMYLLKKYLELMPRIFEYMAWITLILGISLYTANIYYLPEIKIYSKYFHLIPPTNITVG